MGKKVALYINGEQVMRLVDEFKVATKLDAPDGLPDSMMDVGGSMVERITSEGEDRKATMEEFLFFCAVFLLHLVVDDDEKAER